MMTMMTTIMTTTMTTTTTTTISLHQPQLQSPKREEEGGEPMIQDEEEAQ